MSRETRAAAGAGRTGAALRPLFLIEALTLAPLLPRFPDLLARLGLSKGAFGLALAGLPIGAVLGFVVAPGITARLGAWRTAFGSIAALVVAFALPPFATSLASLCVAFALGGVGGAFTEVALNSAASARERRLGCRLVARCHGYWSIGSVGGVLCGGLLAQLGVPPRVQAVSIGLALAVALASVLRSVHPRRADADADADDGNRIRSRPPILRVPLPRLALVPLCLLPLGGLIVEGAMMDWSAIRMRDALGSAPLVAALAFFAFSVAMMLLRLVGDALTERLGERLVMAVSYVATTAGLLLFAQAESAVSAVAASALCGTGSALIYPLALSAAGRTAHDAETAIASVTFTACTLLLGGPPLIGLAAERLGLGPALVAVATLALSFVLLTPVLGARR